MTDFRPFTPDDAVAVASAVLSHAHQDAVAIDQVLSLGDDARRNLVLRGRLVQGGTKSTSIVIKATRAARYDADAETAYQASGFVEPACRELSDPIP